MNLKNRKNEKHKPSSVLPPNILFSVYTPVIVHLYIYSNNVRRACCPSELRTRETTHILCNHEIMNNNCFKGQYQ